VRELKLLSFTGLTNGGARGRAGRALGGGIMQHAKRVVAPLDDYFVIIKRCVDHRKTPQTCWTWEIQRRSKPLGVKFDFSDQINVTHHAGVVHPTVAVLRLFVTAITAHIIRSYSVIVGTPAFCGGDNEVQLSDQF
jgi:hypothetical protein